MIKQDWHEIMQWSEQCKKVCRRTHNRTSVPSSSSTLPIVQFWQIAKYWMYHIQSKTNIWAGAIWVNAYVAFSIRLLRHVVIRTHPHTFTHTRRRDGEHANAIISGKHVEGARVSAKGICRRIEMSSLIMSISCWRTWNALSYHMRIIALLSTSFSCGSPSTSTHATSHNTQRTPRCICNLKVMLRFRLKAIDWNLSHTSWRLSIRLRWGERKTPNRARYLNLFVLLQIMCAMHWSKPDDCANMNTVEYYTMIAGFVSV